MPLGLVALALRYLFLVALLWYVVWVLRAMMQSLPVLDRGETRARPPGHVAPRRADGPVAAEAVSTPAEPVGSPADESGPEPATEQAPGCVQEEPVGPTAAQAVAETSEGPWPPETEAQQSVLGDEEPRLPLEVAPAPRISARKPARKPSPPAPRRLAGFELVVEEPGRSSLRPGMAVPLRAGLHIGRAADNGLVIDDPAVSRQHAYLGPRGDGWVLVDKGSVNGTFVNGGRLRGPRELADGDVIELGGVRLAFRRIGGAGPG